MQRLLCGLVVSVFAGLASGCYVAPPYSYVRGTTYAGSAYYGEGPAVVYGSGCCWAPGVAVGGVWYRGYGGHGYYRGGYRGQVRRGNGQWHGQDGNRSHRNGRHGDGQGH